MMTLFKIQVRFIKWIFLLNTLMRFLFFKLTKVIIPNWKCKIFCHPIIFLMNLIWEGKKKVGKGVRGMYVPKTRSGAYALLIALHKANQVSNHQYFLFSFFLKKRTLNYFWLSTILLAQLIDLQMTNSGWTRKQ